MIEFRTQYTRFKDIKKIVVFEDKIKCGDIALVKDGYQYCSVWSEFGGKIYSNLEDLKFNLTNRIDPLK